MSKGFPGGSVVKNPLANATQSVQSVVQKDPLEKEMATHSSILAWKIPWTEEPGGLQSMESQRVRHNSGTEHASTRKLSTGKKCSRVKNLQGP